MSNIMNFINEEHLIATPAAHLYEHSPFKELRKLPPKSKGTRFEEIAEDVLKKMGYDVQPATSRGHDRIIDGVKTEIKGATLSSPGNHDFQFSFMQIRMNGDWEQLLMMALWPRDARMYTLSKDDVQKYIDCGAIKRQHGGKDSTDDTFIFIGYPDDLLYTREVESLVENPEKGKLTAD